MKTLHADSQTWKDEPGRRGMQSTESSTGSSRAQPQTRLYQISKTALGWTDCRKKE